MPSGDDGALTHEYAAAHPVSKPQCNRKINDRNVFDALSLKTLPAASRVAGRCCAKRKHGRDQLVQGARTAQAGDDNCLAKLCFQSVMGTHFLCELHAYISDKLHGMKSLSQELQESPQAADSQPSSGLASPIEGGAGGSCGSQSF